MTIHSPWPHQEVDPNRPASFGTITGLPGHFPSLHLFITLACAPGITLFPVCCFSPSSFLAGWPRRESVPGGSSSGRVEAVQRAALRRVLLGDLGLGALPSQRLHRSQPDHRPMERQRRLRRRGGSDPQSQLHQGQRRTGGQQKVCLANNGSNYRNNTLTHCRMIVQFVTFCEGLVYNHWSICLQPCVFAEETLLRVCLFLPGRRWGRINRAPPLLSGTVLRLIHFLVSTAQFSTALLATVCHLIIDFTAPSQREYRILSFFFFYWFSSPPQSPHSAFIAGVDWNDTYRGKKNCLRSQSRIFYI